MAPVFESHVSFLVTSKPSSYESAGRAYNVNSQQGHGQPYLGGRLAYQHTFQGKATQNVYTEENCQSKKIQEPTVAGLCMLACLLWTAISHMFCQYWKIIVLHQFKGQDEIKNGKTFFYFFRYILQKTLHGRFNLCG